MDGSASLRGYSPRTWKSVRVMAMPPDHAERIVVAVLQTIDNWRDRVLEAESFAIPGNKARLLSLARDIEQTKISLQRLTGIPGE